MLNILFVCQANTCRSVLAEGLFRKITTAIGLEGKVGIASAGTHVTNESLPPNSKAIQVASETGINLGMIRTRSVRRSDFIDFDYVLAMDEKNLIALGAFEPGRITNRPRLLLDFALSVREKEITDPYDRGIGVYRQTARLIEVGCQEFLAELKARRAL